MKQKTEFMRVEKTKNYSVISNEFIRRKDLSWKAKGILTYILTLPDDWVININEIMTHATEGEKAFRSGWKELKDAGYVNRYPVRDNKSNKITHWETVIRESVDTKASEPLTQNVQVQNVQVQKVHVQNDKLLSTNNTKDLIKPSTNNTNSARHKYGDNQNVLMTKDEYDKLSEKFPNDLEKRINNLSYYMASTGKSYKSHYMTIIAWARRDKENTNTKNKPLDLDNVFDETDNSDQWARWEERKNASNR